MSHNTYKLAAYRSMFIGRTDIDATDKVILHHTLLETLLQRFGDSHLPSPMIFEVTHRLVGTTPTVVRTTHVGVLEFSAPEVGIYLPDWIMENLLLQDSQTVSLRIVNLPKATHAVFQPIKPSFSQISNPRAILENVLGKFTALTEGDTIVIDSNAPGQRLDEHIQPLKVVSVQPKHNNIYHPELASAVCVIDSELNVEFKSEEDGVNGGGSTTSSTAGDRYPNAKSANSSSAPVLPIEYNLAAHQSLPIAINADQYQYYRYKTQHIDQSQDMLITVDSPNVDIYTSLKSSQPTTILHDHRLESIDAKKVLTLRQVLPNTTYYIGLHAYKQGAVGTLNITEVFTKNNTANGSAASTGSTVGTTVATADTQQCQTCLRHISKKQFQMHEIQCQRQNWRCPTCNELLRRSDSQRHVHCAECNAPLDKNELAKHADLRHSPVPCQCGQSFPPDQIVQHQLIDCPKTPTNCQWCNLPVARIELDSHQSYCGAKSIPCKMCGQSVARKRMQIHLAVNHNINPSLQANRHHAVAALHEDHPEARSAASGAASAEHDELARAIAESQKSHASAAAAGMHSVEDDDEALQQALLASQLEHNVSQARTTQTQTMPQQQPLHHRRQSSTGNSVSDEFTHVEYNDDLDDDWNDTNDDTAGDDDAWKSTGHTPSHANTALTTSSSTTATTNTEATNCPYCSKSVTNYDALMAHMEVCDQVK